MKAKINIKDFPILSMLFFIIVIISSITDIIADIGQGANTSHIIQESIIACTALSLLLFLLYHTAKEKNKNNKLIKALEEATELSTKASQELIKAKKLFGDEISKQFLNWQLTKSESDIALFTLKGFNSKEIANLRSVSEKTVRNQLTSIYRKSGLNSKHTFIAWFMDGLF